MLLLQILILCFYVVPLVTFSIGTTNIRDPICSKYDFEEKVLEKLVRIEHRIELYEEKLKSWESTIESKMEKIDKVDLQRAQKIQEVKEAFNDEIKTQKLVVADLVGGNVTSEVSVISKSLENKLDIQTIEILENVTTKLTKVDEIEVKITELSNATRLKQEQLSRDILNVTETLISFIHGQVQQVAMTACVSTEGSKSNGEILKFDDVRTQFGINQLSTFKSNGKFTCEKDGLYHVSVSIVSLTGGAKYSIYRNSDQLLQNYISSSSNAETGTTVVAVVLEVGDTIWVRAESYMYVYARYWSCITIVKIK